MSNVDLHTELINQLHELYKAKNADYGNSVHDTYQKYGLTAFLVRMDDKMNRLRSLTQNNKVAQIKDEKIEDTLMDLANYALLAIIELRNKE